MKNMDTSQNVKEAMRVFCSQKNRKLLLTHCFLYVTSWEKTQALPTSRA